MPSLEVAGYRSDVEIVSVDEEGWCHVWFPATGNRAVWMSVHLHTLTFGPNEQRPAGVFGRPGELTGRERFVLNALLRVGYHGLTAPELVERCGIDLEVLRRVCARLRDRRLIRNSAITRPALGRSWAVWEITIDGEHALKT